MALNFTKKAAAAANVEIPPEGDTLVAEKPKTEAKKPTAKTETAHDVAPGKMSWMKRGQDAKVAAAHEAAKDEQAALERGKLWDFWLVPGDSKIITFLDGNLDADGMLDIMFYYQHLIRLNGEMENFVCTAEADQTQPCPICEKGDKPSYVGVMTVIDHTPYTVKKGKNAGNIIVNSRKLFVAKKTTIQLLTTLAKKRGGLQYATFDVSRTDDKKPAVGDVFDFTEKFTSAGLLAKKYDLKPEDVAPGNYEEEITYRSPDQLLELGVGKMQSGIGYDSKGGTSKSNFKDEL